MRRTTGIEWTDHTWNPIVGCSLASAGCTNCYAMRMAHRLAAFGQPVYRGLTRSSKGGPVWSGVIRQASKAQLAKPERIAGGTNIFVNSMSDLFHPNAPDAWRDDAYSVMRRVARHRYQILTKRPEVAAHYYAARPAFHNLPHVWLGVSVERADVRERIDILRRIPAAIRFLSIEPLIGPPGDLDLEGIHWVIAGGESGPAARPCEPAWLRTVRDQCRAARVPFFLKQHGAWTNNPLVREIAMTIAEARAADLDPSAKGGASLDGRLWRQMPLAEMHRCSFEVG